MKNKYINISVFAVLATLVCYLCVNIYTYIKYSAFVPVSFYFLILAIGLPFGLLLVFQQQMIKKYYLRKITKELEKELKK
jgi:hypothetical protein